MYSVVRMFQLNMIFFIVQNSVHNVHVRRNGARYLFGFQNLGRNFVFYFTSYLTDETVTLNAPEAAVAQLCRRLVNTFSKLDGVQPC